MGLSSYTRKNLLRKCELKDDENTRHCFSDATHYTCCELGKKAKTYANRSGNPIGTAADRSSTAPAKNTWCTCLGSMVCSKYRDMQQDGTRVRFVADPRTGEVEENGDERILQERFGIVAHGTPGVFGGGGGGGGGNPNPNVLDPALLERARKIVYPRYKKPSAYRSGARMKKYVELGGRYKQSLLPNKAKTFRSLLRSPPWLNTQRRRRGAE